ncbi:MAG: thiamine phosphate synthase, partial [Rhodospirillales bacterium]|nr:thiamine phosphate synthase [Rhodospirillales bacterium]
ADLRREIAHARDLCAQTGCQLIVNDHWRLALDLGCDYIHLGQEDLDEADLTAIRAAKLKLGISSPDKQELARALSLAHDYVALGPIYPTALKAMRWAPQGLEKIGIWKQRIGALPLVAIGGLTVERAAGAFAAGADSCCVVTDVLRAEDPEARLSAWLDAAASAKATA